MEKPSNICVTCLSKDRRLISIDNITAILEEIGCHELKFTGSMCWECRSIMMKFHRFKIKAYEAQQTLTGNIQIENIKPLTSLVSQINQDNDKQYYYLFDPLIETEETQIEEDIKEEYNESLDNNDSNISDNEKLAEVTVRVDVDVESLSKEKKKPKIDQAEFEKKFIKVVFSEEEMLKNREDKKNHYNYKKIPFKCDLCVLGFTRKNTYDVHMKKKHDESIGRYECNVCKCRFNTKTTAQSHRNRHYTCYKCRLCRYNTTELCAAHNHCILKHEKDDVDSIHCSQCDEIVKSREELEAHIQSTHTLYCNECGVRFKGKHTLRSHKTRFHGTMTSREYPCSVCGRTFCTAARLEAHATKHSARVARSLSYCAICRVQYKNIYVYRSHLRNSANHAERTYSCPECNKKFASKVYWRKHYDFYHLRKSQYNCQICNKLFISEWRLTNHRQKHHGLSRSRDHACNHCGKKFFTQSMLRNHELTHSEQRSYMCEDCGDTFKQRPALYTHAKLVHGDKRKK